MGVKQIDLPKTRFWALRNGKTEEYSRLHKSLSPDCLRIIYDDGVKIHYAPDIDIANTLKHARQKYPATIDSGHADTIRRLLGANCVSDREPDTVAGEGRLCA